MQKYQKKQQNNKTTKQQNNKTTKQQNSKTTTNIKSNFLPNGSNTIR